MRVLLLTHYYPPEVGAPQRRWDAVIAHLRAHGVRVNVITPPPHYPHGYMRDEHRDFGPGTRSRGEHGELAHRTRFVPYDSELRRRGLDQVVAAADAVRIGLQRFRRHRPDVIVVTAPGLPTALGGVLLGRLLRVPVVLEMRDAWPDLISYPEQWNDDRPNLLGNVLANVAYHLVTGAQRRATALVTTSEAFAERMRTRRMPPVHVIYTGTRQRPVAERLAHDGPLRILYLGTVGRSQDLEAAVRATAAVQERGGRVQMRIVGDGALRAHVQRLADELDAPVDFLQPVAPTEIGAHYAWADTILVSLRAWEPMKWTVPSKLFEVLATGRHVTGTLA